jgi:hypothetical protein
MVSSYRLAGRYLLPDKVKRRKEDTMSNLIQRFKEDLQLAGFKSSYGKSNIISIDTSTIENCQSTVHNINPLRANNEEFTGNFGAQRRKFQVKRFVG